MNFILTHKREVATLTAEHLWLVGISMLLAIAIGVPLGILLTRRPRWKALVLGSTTSSRRFPAWRCSDCCCRFPGWARAPIGWP